MQIAMKKTQEGGILYEPLNRSVSRSRTNRTDLI